MPDKVAMMSEMNGEDRWLVFDLNKQRYALNVSHAVELTRVSDDSVCVLPGMPSCFRGAINLRGRIVPLLDLRLVLGMRSAADETNELVELFDTREKDHINWLRELEACVEEERPFKLATDPHKCGFGQWYDGVMMDKSVREALTGHDLSLETVLEAFDEPHKRIHAIAVRVTAHSEAGERDKAFAIIEQTRDTDLQAMIELFGRAKALVRERRRPLVFVLEHDDVPLGLIMDHVHGVQGLDPAGVEPPPPMTTDSDLVSGVYKDGDGLVTLLDAEGVFERYGARAQAA
jgi:purine-binding chemotaxis protein CheW